MFFARYEEGGLVPARKGLDGVYHVDGDLVVADREAQYAILKLCRPLWEAAGGKNFVIVGPMPRYVSASCCPDTEHIPNRLNDNFYEKLKMDLTTTSSTIKDYLFSSGLRNGRVMDPQRNMAGLAPNDIWDSDPIHPKKCIYEKLAEGVREVEKGCGKGKRKRSADDTGWGADWSSSVSSSRRGEAGMAGTSHGVSSSQAFNKRARVDGPSRGGYSGRGGPTHSWRSRSRPWHRGRGSGSARGRRGRWGGGN